MEQLQELLSDEITIQVAASGVNNADLLQARGLYPPPPGASTELGLEVSGTVIAAGSEARFCVGDRVCALLAGGGYLPQVTTSSALALEVPGGLSLETAAGLPEVAATSWLNLVKVGGLKAGDNVLIHGGSGGVGTFAIQLAKALGATVWTSAGSPERAERLLQLGADFAFDYHLLTEPSLHLPEILVEKMNLVLDIVGGKYLAANLNSLAKGGKLVVIGLQKGARAELNIGQMLMNNLTIVGTTLRSKPNAEKAEIIAELRERVWPLIAAGKISPSPTITIPVENWQQAHRRLGKREVFGKIVLSH